MPNDNSSLMHLKFVLGHQHRNREIIWPVANKKIQTKIQTLYRNSNLIEIFRNGLRANVFLFRLKKKLKSALFISLN